MVVAPIYKIWDNNRKVIIYVVLPKRKYFTIKIRKRICPHVKYFFNPYKYNKFPEVYTSDEIIPDTFYKNFTKISEIPNEYKEIIKRNNFDIY